MTSTALTHPIPFPVLIGDIGGTNARFAVLTAAPPRLHPFPNVETASFASIENAIHATVLPEAPARPRAAVLALAAPIRGDRVPLTNCPWVVDPSRLITELGVEEVILLNDFEALALSLPVLDPGDYDAIGGGEIRAGFPKIVVGPGTGLGAAALMPSDGAWIPVPGEGGHVDLGPRTERDAAIWRHLAPPGDRIEAERVISGPGLVRLYRAVAAASGAEARFTTAAEITAAGLKRSDPVAAESLDLFATYLGRYAGDLAVVFLARGGVYLAGGISRRLAGFLKESAFREAFLDKRPHRALMEQMATVVVTHPNPALSGLAAFVRDPARFRIDLTARRWRRTAGGGGDRAV